MNSWVIASFSYVSVNLKLCRTTIISKYLCVSSRLNLNHLVLLLSLCQISWEGWRQCVGDAVRSMSQKLWLCRQLYLLSGHSRLLPPSYRFSLTDKSFFSRLVFVSQPFDSSSFSILSISIALVFLSRMCWPTFSIFSVFQSHVQIFNPTFVRFSFQWIKSAFC